nr:nitrate regulatory gene2 protein-like isoform X1 [Arachis hypogaea]
MELPSNVKNVHTEREDPSQFITHRAKDFVTSMKEIEHRFFRTFESGREVSSLLEANKIIVRYSESKGKPSAIALLRAFHSVFHGRKVRPLSKGTAQKVICWRRIVPSQSSSFKDSLASTSKEDMDQDADGSNSCILERLYAWEKKLYDEVKASESIRKEYDRKCEQLRHQSAKDESTRVIDKTRSIVRDLHSRIIVTIYSFDTISKQIERVRDKELLLQLLELNQGLIKMWRAMLECHHAQFIIISLAYHSKSSTRTIEANARREILTQLLEEFKCLALASIIGLTAIPHTSNLSMDGCKTAYYILLIVPRIEGGRSSLAVFLPLRYLFFAVINLQGSRHYWPRI